MNNKPADPKQKSKADTTCCGPPTFSSENVAMASKPKKDSTATDTALRTPLNENCPAP